MKEFNTSPTENIRMIFQNSLLSLVLNKYAEIQINRAQNCVRRFLDIDRYIVNMKVIK